MAKILQVDNGKEIDNQYIKQYCIEYDIKLILSSLYHPQTNGSVEVIVLYIIPRLMVLLKLLIRKFKNIYLMNI